MQHKNPDRVPIDIGGTSLTGMRSDCQENLRRWLGFTGKSVPSNNGIDERILAWAGTDFRSVGAIVDLPSVHTRTLSLSAHIDCWGIRRDFIIDCGVDILNPIQTSAAHMDPKRLKDRFGDRVVFGGAVDVQQFLPQASCEEIPERIHELIRILGWNGDPHMIMKAFG
ncbi:MAG: hypothetical protein P1S60_12880 [Anaerolineae bacterium]|nr:hypothetical protein [Anaerolineae bacterium]